MGSRARGTTAERSVTSDERLVAFARQMKDMYDARVYLFGSRARGTGNAESDYDVVAVSEAFSGQRKIDRVADRYDLWRKAGGWGWGLDLHCYTPNEFRRELAGLGYLGQAKRRGELLYVRVGSPKGYLI